MMAQNGADCIVIHPADYFVDGNMWTLQEYRGQIHEVAQIDHIKSCLSKSLLQTV